MSATTNRRTTLLAPLFTIIGLLLAACGDEDGTASDITPGAGSSEGDTRASGAGSAPAPSDDVSDAATTTSVGFAVPILRGPPLKAQDDYFRFWAQENGFEYSSLDADYNANKQVSDIDTLVQQGVDILFVWPIDPAAVQPALDRARDAGVILIVEETTQGGPFFTNVQHDDEAAGEMAADYIADAVGADAQVGVVFAPAQVEALAKRNQGFQNRAAEIGLQIVEEQTAQQLTPEESAAFTDGFKLRHPDLDAIFGSTDIIALGAASRLGGDFTPTVVSIDAYEATVELVTGGQVTATLDPQIIDTAKVMAWAAEQAIAGEEVPENLWVDYEAVDGSNAADWQNYADSIAAPGDVILDERDDRTYASIEGN